MVRILLALSLALVALPRTATAQPDVLGDRSTVVPLRVLSFNIRYDNPADSLDAWPHRKGAVAGIVRFHGIDVVGLQEAQRGQLDDLDSLLAGFAWFGQPRADGGPRDEYSAVLYRTDRLELLDHDTFWLSETPDVPSIRGWDAAYPRIVTWGQFRDRIAGDALYLFNTHFDHVGEEARVESARLLRREVRRIAGDAPVVAAGDFNAVPDSEPYRVLTEMAQDDLIGTAAPIDTFPDDAFADAAEVSAEPPYGPNSTWNGFGAIVSGRRIDYIFVRGDGVSVRRYGTLAETYDGKRFASDHLPVLADIVVE